MCGGRGTRLDSAALRDTEKSLVEVRGVPMVERVLAALCDSRVERVSLITSSQAPDTREHLASLLDTGEFGSPVTILGAPGEGYVSDLRYALRRVSSPTLTVASDLPLLAPAVLDRVLDRAEGSRRSLAVCVPAALKRLVGTSTDSTWMYRGRELAPTGLNVVAHEPERTTGTDRDEAPSIDTVPPAHADPRADDRRGNTDVVNVSYDARLAVNVNRPADLAVAEALCE